MQYHAVSLANQADANVRSALPTRRNILQNPHVANAQVSLIGFEGERCVDDVEDNQYITKFLLTNPFAHWSRALFLLWAPMKVLYQVSAVNSRIADVPGSRTRTRS